MYLLVHSKILVESLLSEGTMVGSGNLEKKDIDYKESYSSGKTESPISIRVMVWSSPGNRASLETDYTGKVTWGKYSRKPS